MEVIIISKYIQLILTEDFLEYKREDVVSEEFKSQIFYYKDIRKGKFMPKATDWLTVILIIIMGGSAGTPLGEPMKIELLLMNNKTKLLYIADLNK